jgi:hypothetical protein
MLPVTRILASIEADAIVACPCVKRGESDPDCLSQRMPILPDGRNEIT